MMTGVGAGCEVEGLAEDAEPRLVGRAGSYLKVITARVSKARPGPPARLFPTAFPRLFHGFSTVPYFEPSTTILTHTLPASGKFFCKGTLITLYLSEVEISRARPR